MLTKLIYALLTLSLLAGLAACNVQAALTADGGAQLARSDKQRQSAPQVDPAEQQLLVEGNTAFALDLYQTLRHQEGNLFYSPYSISLALAMTYAGAGSQTEAQMAQALCFDLPQERLHPAFNSLDLSLTALGQQEASEEADFRLNIANSLWGQRDYTFKPEFLDVLAQNYGAGLRLLDFTVDPDGSRRTINDWVSQETEQKIKDLIPEGAIDPLTRLVLANAIYFNAPWLHEFNQSATQDESFYLLDGSEIKTPLMKQTGRFAYVDGDGYRAVEMPYQGGRFSMIVLLPDAGGFEAFEDHFDAALLKTVRENLQHHEVVLSMPRYKFESQFALVDALKELGMTDAFEYGLADFSGMDGTRELYISDVAHKAFVAVDEEGTEAAAATAIIVGTMAMPEPEEPVVLTIDRPFLFLIGDRRSDALLFVGRVMQP